MATGGEQQGAQVATDLQRVLGVNFYNGDASQAAERMAAAGGLLVAPASPALLNLKFDDAYRRALQQADVALADSALLAAIWKLRSGHDLRNISGFTYLKALLARDDVRNSGDTVFVVASQEERRKALSCLAAAGIMVTDASFHVAGQSGGDGEDHELLLLLEERRPRHVIIALRAGAQEKLGLYLREYLLYRPSIHCVGAALGFLSGTEGAIPPWAEQHQLGWLARLFAQPGMLIPRIGIAATITGMVFKYGSEMPKLRARWSEL